jgi:hypothetical protein
VAFALGAKVPPAISERLPSGCLMALFVITSGSHADKTVHVQHKLRIRQPRATSGLFWRGVRDFGSILQKIGTQASNTY